MTVPNLIQKWEDRHTVSAVKEAYAILNHAFKLAINEEGGDITTWSFDPNINYSLQLGKKLKQYLKVDNFYDDIYAKKEEFGFDPHADWKPMVGNGFTGTAANTYHDPLLQLSNGMDIYVELSRPEGYGELVMMGQIFVDINGKKGPNRSGYDFFVFPFNKDGLIESQRSISAYPSTYPMFCSINLNNNNTGYSYSGLSCTRWIIKHGNCDYKYKDVSQGQRWDSPWI